MILALVVVSFLLLILGRGTRPVAARTSPGTGRLDTRVAVLVPLAGDEPEVDRFLERVLAFDPAPAAVLLIIEEDRRDDPCARRVRQLERGGLPDHVHVVAAPRATNSSQKAASLLAGLAHVPDAEVIVTIDSDTLPHEGAVGALTSALDTPQTTVATGYRWMIPGRGLTSLIMAVWNGAGLAILSDPNRAFAWGGATAIRRRDLEELGIVEHWQRALSTDMAITQAVREAGGRIVLVPAAVVPSTERPSAVESWRWIVRQLVMFHRSDPRLGSMIFAYHVLLAATQVGTLAVLAGWGGLVEPARIGAAMLMFAPTLRGILRAGSRFERLRDQPIADVEGWDARQGEQMVLAAFITWIMLAGLVASSVVRNVTWRGVRYGIGPANTASWVDWSEVELDPAHACTPDSTTVGSA